MKTIKILLAFMALIAVKASAQEVTVNSPSEKAIVENIEKSTTLAMVSNIQTQNGSDAERTKSFSKSFSVDNNDKVNLNNQYGSIVIKTWDKKEVKVDIDIKAYSNSDSDAQKLIDGVSIEANKTGDVVSIKTNFADRGGNNFMGRITKNGVTKRRELKISYIIYMPAVNPLTLMQQYGNVNMDDFAGPTSLKVQYGSLTAGNLSNTNNYINVQYGKCTVQDINAAVVKHSYNGPVSIGSVGTLELAAEYVAVNVNTIRKSADIKVEYGGGLTVGNIGGNLLLNTEYAKVDINSVKGNTVIKQGYGSLNLASVGKLNLKTEYTNVSLGALNGDALIDMEYNKLSVADITPACRNFTFTGEYVSTALGFNDRYNANFNLSTSYAGFKYGSNVSASKVSDDDETKKYAGKIGSGGSATVNVKSEYGSITFK
ncbi:hypothetical protein [Pedobacter kyungheensis]|nr:hypothetical protein [Pedobacter kyungheensis]